MIYAFILDMRPTLARAASKTLAVALLAVLAACRRPAAAGRRAGAQRRRRRLPVARRRQGFSRRAGQFPCCAYRSISPLFLRSGGGLASAWRRAPGVARSRSPWRSFAVVMLAALWRRVGPGLRLPIAVYVVGDPGDGHVGADARTALRSIGGACCSWRRTGCSPRRNSWCRRSRPIVARMRFAVWVLYYAAQLRDHAGLSC